MRHAITTTAAAALAAVTLGSAASAHADAIGIRDPQDTFHGSDLRAVQVRHLDQVVAVVTSHTNLRRDPATGSAGAVYLDTDRSDRGPEVVFVGGFYEGTDYQLRHTDGFGRRQWGDPVDGFYEMRVNYAKERVRFRMARDTLGRPGEVRVAVRVSGTRTDGTSTGLVDWLGEPRSFTPWVERG